MQGAIGYGGLIHSVNNFVLRKDISQLINGHESVLELDVILRAYRQIGISPSEEQALSKIELVRSNYRQALVRAEILIRQGQPVEEIDRVIKVDDGPAILALKELKKVVAEQRYSSIRKLSNQVNSTSRVVIVSAISAGVILILLSVLLAWFIRVRIVSPIVTLVNAFDSVDPETIDGTRLPTSSTARPNELGQLAISGNRFLTAIENQLTERRLAEDKLSAIVENTGEGIVTINSSGEIELFNQGAEKIFGYAASEVIGSNVAVLVPEAERLEHDRFVKQSEIHAPRIINRSRDLQGQRKNGELFPLELNIAPMEVGTNNKFVGIMRDVSKRKLQELELISARDAAEAANLAKSEFLSSMSHELRTPMNAILGFGQLMEGDPVEELSPRQLDYVGQILRGGEHLLELIDQVLELSKIESGNLTYSLEAFDVIDVMEEASAMVAKSAAENGIKFKNLKDSHDKLLVWADRSRVRQVLLNLLSNAIKYNSKNGTVTLDAEVLDTSEIKISISDTGYGIPENKQAHLFEPFNRLGREAGEIEGTGIGLTITKQIVELLDGHVGFDSKVGEGSNFWVTFPLAATSQILQDSDLLPHAHTLAGNFDMGQKTILYIEDNPTNLRLMQEVIRQIPDMQMLSAHNAEIGLAVARENKTDIILMDINLPGMSGIDALKVLRTHSNTSEIPVIALTAAAMPSEIAAGKAAGFEDYIIKPINVPEVLSALNKHMN